MDPPRPNSVVVAPTTTNEPAGWSSAAGLAARLARDWVRLAQVAGEVSVQGRPDRLDQVVGRRLLQWTEFHHVPGQAQAQHLAGDQGRPEPGVISAAGRGVLDRLGQPADDGARDELAHHADRLFAGGGRPQQAQEGGPHLRDIPDTQHGPQQVLAKAASLAGGAGREHGSDHVRGVDRQAHRRREQAFLVAVEVVHQRRVHPGVGRDAADRRAVVAEVAEPGPGRGQDRLPGTAVTATPPAAPPALPIAPPPARAGRPAPPGLPRRAGHPATSVTPDDSVSWKKRSSRVAGADVTVALIAPSARLTSAGGTPGTRSVRPTSATGRPACSSTPNAAAHDPAGSGATTVTWASPVISAAVPCATTRPAAMMASRSHS